MFDNISLTLETVSSLCDILLKESVNNEDSFSDINDWKYDILKRLIALCPCLKNGKITSYIQQTILIALAALTVRNKYVHQLLFPDLFKLVQLTKFNKETGAPSSDSDDNLSQFWTINFECDFGKTYLTYLLLADRDEIVGKSLLDALVNEGKSMNFSVVQIIFEIIAESGKYQWYNEKDLIFDNASEVLAFAKKSYYSELIPLSLSIVDALDCLVFQLSTRNDRNDFLLTSKIVDFAKSIIVSTDPLASSLGDTHKTTELRKAAVVLVINCSKINPAYIESSLQSALAFMHQLKLFQFHEVIVGEILTRDIHSEVVLDDVGYHDIRLTIDVLKQLDVYNDKALGSVPALCIVIANACFKVHSKAANNSNNTLNDMHELAKITLDILFVEVQSVGFSNSVCKKLIRACFETCFQVVRFSTSNASSTEDICNNIISLLGNAIESLKVEEARAYIYPELIELLIHSNVLSMKTSISIQLAKIAFTGEASNDAIEKNLFSEDEATSTAVVSSQQHKHEYLDMAFDTLCNSFSNITSRIQSMTSNSYHINDTAPIVPQELIHSLEGLAVGLESFAKNLEIRKDYVRLYAMKRSLIDLFTFLLDQSNAFLSSNVDDRSASMSCCTKGAINVANEGVAIGLLLSPIATIFTILTECSSNASDTTSGNIHDGDVDKSRMLWYFLVAFRCKFDFLWSNMGQWSSHYKAIAMHTLPLIHDNNDTTWYFLEKEIVSHLSLKVFIRHFNREKYCSIVDLPFEHIKTLDAEKSLLVITSYYIESLRVCASMDVRFILHYLHDSDAHSHFSKISAVMLPVLDIVFDSWVEKAVTCIDDSASIEPSKDKPLDHVNAYPVVPTTKQVFASMLSLKALIIQVFLFFLSMSCNRNVTVQRKAIRYCTIMIDSFPWLICYPVSVISVIDIIDALSSRYDALDVDRQDEYFAMDKHSLCDKVDDATMPPIDITLRAHKLVSVQPADLPDSMNALLECAQSVFVLTYSWFTKGIDSYKIRFSCILHECIINDRVNMQSQHYGVTFASEILTNQTATFHKSAAVDVKFKSERTLASSRASSLVTRAQSVNNVDLTLDLMLKQSCVSEIQGSVLTLDTAMAFDGIAKHLLNEVMLLQAELLDDTDGARSSNVEYINHVIWKIATVVRCIGLEVSVISADSASAVYVAYVIQLIQACCKILITYLTESTMSATLAAFRWIIVAQPAFIPLVMSEVYAITRWSVNKKTGIFSVQHAHVSSSSSCADDRPKFKLTYDSIDGVERRSFSPKIHMLLINFMSEHCDCDIEFAEDVFECIEHMLSFHPPSVAHDPDSFVAYFTLLSAAFKVIEHTLVASKNVSIHRRRVLRERIVLFASYYFSSSNRMIINHIKQGSVTDQYHALSTFNRLLSHDTKLWCMDYPTHGLMDEYYSTFSRNCMSSPFMYLAEMMGTVIFYNLQSRIPLQPLVAASVLGMNVQGNSIVNNGVLSLLRLQIYDELDRIASWSGERQLQSIQQREYGSKFNAVLNSKSYDEATKAAWCIHPSIAIALFNNLPKLGRRHSVISSLVTTNCKQTRNLPSSYTIYLSALKGMSMNSRYILSKELQYWSMMSPASVIATLTRISSYKDGNSSSNDHSHSYDPMVFKFCIRSLDVLDDKTFQFYLPELIQLLRHDHFGGLQQLLLDRACKCHVMCCYLVNLLVTEMYADSNRKKAEAEYGYCNQLRGIDPLISISSGVLQKLRSMLSPSSLLLLDQQHHFFDFITNVSAVLKQVKDKDEHSNVIKECLSKLVVTGGLHLPTSPDKIVASIDIDSGMPMQSAAKCPYLLTFSTTPQETAVGSCNKGVTMPTSVVTAKSSKKIRGVGKKDAEGFTSPKRITFSDNTMGAATALDMTSSPVVDTTTKLSPSKASGLTRWSTDKKKTFDRGISSSSNSANVSHDSCIFKVYDDCRQDTLTIQIVQLLKDNFHAAGLPVYLRPYRVISTRTGDDHAVGGILEVVPQVKSLDRIGKDGCKRLEHYFTMKFGASGTYSYKKAQYEFARSLAGYAVVCYLLSIKDRHNGNILIDNDGHIIHIDYGFLLGTSPGGNLGFERAGFKLTSEMIDLLDGFNSTIFRQFVEMTVKAYLCARESMNEILSIVSACADSGLPCFMHKKDNLFKLRSRFVPDATQSEAASHMRKIIYSSANNWTTNAYDGIQKLQQNIHSHIWR